MQDYTVLTQLYCQIYINNSTACFGPYGHLQVGYDIRRKTIYNMVHYKHQCGVLYHIIYSLSSDIQPEDGHKGRNM